MAKTKRRITAQPLSSLPVRFLRLHGKLAIAAVIGGVIPFLMPDTIGRPIRFLTGWDLGVAIYLILTLTMILRADVPSIRKRACEQDEGGFVVMVLAISAAAASFIAVVFVLGAANEAEHGEWYALMALGTIVLSWAFIHTIFTLRYAHEYYGEGHDGETGGLDFPGKDEPDYGDFLYFALVIGMTSQVSDVPVTSRSIRRMTTAHALLSFFFNVAVLALTVNSLSNLI